MSEQTHRMFNEIVLEGVLEDRGMSNFSDRLSEADVNDIYAYINSRAWQDYKLQEEAKASTQSGSPDQRADELISSQLAPAWRLVGAAFRRQIRHGQVTELKL